MKQLSSFFKKALVCMAALSLTGMAQAGGNGKTWVDYVNPYIGNISHLLVPTFPTVQLPNSMLRVYPERADFTADRINGLPLIVTHHRERSAFNLSVYCGDIGSLRDNVISYTYDNERITPYSYSAYLDGAGVQVDYSLSHQSGIYRLQTACEGVPAYLLLNSGNGSLTVKGSSVSGWQWLDAKTRVYLYAEL